MLGAMFTFNSKVPYPIKRPKINALRAFRPYGANTSFNLFKVPFRKRRKQLILPLKYLGLPLSMNRLKRVDFQPWIDKVSAKLSTWSGKNLSAAGRLTLVNVVLTSQVTYLLLALIPPIRVLNLIDSKRKQFLWTGSER